MSGSSVHLPGYCPIPALVVMFIPPYPTNHHPHWSPRTLWNTFSFVYLFVTMYCLFERYTVTPPQTPTTKLQWLIIQGSLSLNKHWHSALCSPPFGGDLKCHNYSWFGVGSHHSVHGWAANCDFVHFIFNICPQRLLDLVISNFFSKFSSSSAHFRVVWPRIGKSGHLFGIY